MRLFYLFLFFKLSLFCLYAQQPASIQLTEKDGLPDIEFYNIIEDSKKYIWLAADKGLYRYNGRIYEHFTHPEQRGNAVFGTLEDTKGRVWCNNISGQFFYVENGKLNLFIDLSKKLNGELTEFIVTPEELIVFPGRGKITVNLKSKDISALEQPNVLIGSVGKIGEGYLVSENINIKKKDKNFKNNDNLKLDVFEQEGQNIVVTGRIIVRSNNKINLCYFAKDFKNEMYSFDFVSNTFQKIFISTELQSLKIVSVFFKNNEIWLATDFGIFICQLSGQELIVKNKLFKNTYVTKVLEDSNANHWVITKGNGIIVLPNVNIIQYQNSSKYNINEAEKVDDSLLIFGTVDGIIGKFNTRSHNLNVIDNSSKYSVSEIINLPRQHEVLISKEDSNFTYNTQTERLTQVDHLELKGAKSVAIFNEDKLMISTYKWESLYDFNSKTQDVLIRKRSYDNYASISSGIVYTANIQGFYAFDDNLNKSEIRYKDKPIFAKQITETLGGKIWIATYNEGVLGISKNKVTDVFTAEDILLSDQISTIKGDGNFLWVATNSGIQYINTKTKSVKNLTLNDGLPSYRISAIEVFGNDVFFTSNKGLFSLNKTTVFKSEKIPDVFISKVSVGEIEFDKKPEYSFDYDQNSIKIEFNANGFQSHKNNTYVFRLLGQNEDWQIIDNNANAVNFYSLPSGKYSFEIKSILNTSNLKEKTAVVKFTIAKPFWKTWWFYALLTCAAALLLFLFYSKKINALKQKQDEAIQKEMTNKRLVMSQLENLRSQMNPHFIFNALNSIQEYIVMNEKNLASSFLIKFSRLIRTYLDHSRKDQVLLSEEIEALELYLQLEKDRFEDVLNYNIFVSPNVDTKSIKIPSLFIQPYIENALKHGLLHKKNDRELTISFSKDEARNILFCSIEDNGIGIEASQKINKERYPKHKSFATSANRKRVRLLNENRAREIKVEIKSLKSEFNNGTMVLITIPLIDKV